MNKRYTDETNHTTLVTDLLLPSGRLLQCLWYIIKWSCDKWQQIFKKINVQNKCLTNEIQVPLATSRKAYLTLTFNRHHHEGCKLCHTISLNWCSKPSLVVCTCYSTSIILWKHEPPCLSMSSKKQYFIISSINVLNPPSTMNIVYLGDKLHQNKITFTGLVNM
jgi:hypothetical protein